MNPVLTLRDIRKSFGDNVVIDGLSLDVARGEVHGLIGPNGAGKTTALNIATGVYRPTRGSVIIAGRDVTAMSPYQRARRGMSRTFQGGRPFELLSARENVRIALDQRHKVVGDVREGAAPALDADTLLADIGLIDSADVPARSLSYGKQKQLEIARALAFSTAVLLLDEPTAGLSATEIDLVLDVIARHRGHLGILLIEHNMDIVMSLCHRVTVIEAGTWLATGSPVDVQTNPKVMAAYLGT